MTTFRWLTRFGLFTAVVAVCCAGCNRPEITRDELGTIVTEYPDLPNRAEILPLPEGADAHCPLQEKKQVMEQFANTVPNAAKTPAQTPAVSDTAVSDTPEPASEISDAAPNAEQP